jgi:hypothetical protein
MINTSTLASLIQTWLNDYATDFVFQIYPNEGQYLAAVQSNQRQLPTEKVYGVLSDLPTDITPLTNLGLYTYTQELEVLAPVERGANANVNHIDKVVNVLRSFLQGKSGQSGTITDSESNVFAYVLSLSNISVGVENTGSFGTAIPVTLSVSWQFIKNGVLANNCTLTIDGELALCTSHTIEWTSVPQIDNVENSTYLKGYNSAQAITVSFVIPYLNTPLCKKLVNQIWDGDLSTTYTVKYSDGIVADKTKTMIALGIKQSGQPGLIEAISGTLNLSR